MFHTAFGGAFLGGHGSAHEGLAGSAPPPFDNRWGLVWFWLGLCVVFFLLIKLCCGVPGDVTGRVKRVFYRKKTVKITRAEPEYHPCTEHHTVDYMQPGVHAFVAPLGHPAVQMHVPIVSAPTCTKQQLRVRAICAQLLKVGDLLLETKSCQLENPNLTIPQIEALDQMFETWRKYEDHTDYYKDLIALSEQSGHGLDGVAWSCFIQICALLRDANINAYTNSDVNMKNHFPPLQLAAILYIARAVIENGFGGDLKSIVINSLWLNLFEDMHNIEKRDLEKWIDQVRL